MKLKQLDKNKKTKEEWQPIVLAFIRKQNQILLGQRPRGRFKDLWEFPGGKIEWAETPEEALQRELKEELDIKAYIGSLKWACTFNYSHQGMIFLFYEVLDWVGDLNNKYHKSLKWFLPEELSDLSMPDVNKLYIGKIIEILSGAEDHG